MKKMISRLSVMLLAFFTLASCEEAAEKAEELGIEYDVESLTIEFDAEPVINEETFSFTSYFAWSVELTAAEGTADTSWIGVDPMQGTAGVSTMTIKVTNNDSESSRTCYAKIVAGVYDITVTITQRGLAEATPDVTAIKKVSSITILSGDYEGEIEFNYNEDGSVSYIGLGDGYEFDYEGGVYDIYECDMAVSTPSDMSFYWFDAGCVDRFVIKGDYTLQSGSITYEGGYMSKITAEYTTYNTNAEYVCTWDGDKLTKVEGYAKSSSDEEFSYEGSGEFTYSSQKMGTNIDLNELIVSQVNAGRSAEYFSLLYPMRSLGYLGASTPYLMSTASDVYPSDEGDYSSTATITVEESNEDGSIAQIHVVGGNGDEFEFLISYVEE